jgi:hypothetical protein
VAALFSGYDHQREVNERIVRCLAKIQANQDSIITILERLNERLEAAPGSTFNQAL